jgi:hypothetical protein
MAIKSAMTGPQCHRGATSLTTPDILADQREHRAAERVRDRPIVVIWLPKPSDGLDVERIRRAFPELQVVEMTARGPVATHR